MTLDDVIQDMYALEGELRSFERKYGVLSVTFYEAYQQGEEPPHEDWVRDWAAWASAYDLWQKRRATYEQALCQMKDRGETTVAVMEKTARHEPIPVPA